MTAPGPAHPEIPFVDMGALHAPLVEELAEAFHRVLHGADFVIGPEVETFEVELAAAVSARHAVGVNSGTAALALTLQAAGIGPGQEVLFPSNSFYATAGAIKGIGATPVPVDIDPATGLLDLAAADAAVTERTAALAVVHLYGNPVDMTAARALAKRHGLFLLEDAAQAIGAIWDGSPVGSLGDAAAFSFYPTKNLGALGQGGAVTTSDPDLARRVALLREHGEIERHHHVVWGHNERLDGMQAAFLRVKLGRLSEVQLERDRAARTYRALLADVEGVDIFAIDDRAHHVHHLMVVKVDERDRVRKHLTDAGIGNAVHYPVPVHRQPAFVETEGEWTLPFVEQHADTVVSLPMFPGITDAQINRVVDELAVAVESSHTGRA